MDRLAIVWQGDEERETLTVPGVFGAGPVQLLLRKRAGVFSATYPDQASWQQALERATSCQGGICPGPSTASMVMSTWPWRSSLSSTRNQVHGPRRPMVMRF